MEASHGRHVGTGGVISLRSNVTSSQFKKIAIGLTPGARSRTTFLTPVLPPPAIGKVCGFSQPLQAWNWGSWPVDTGPNRFSLAFVDRSP